MKFLLTILVAAVAAYAALRSTRPAPARDAQASAADGAALSELRAAAAELGRENQRLADELERRRTTLVSASAPPRGVGEAEIHAALERWRAAHPEGAQTIASGKTNRPAVASDEREVSTMPIGELVTLLSGEGLTHLDRQELFQKLRETGRIDEYVAAIEKLAAADPENADLQVALGNAYLQKLFGVGNTPEAGTWAIKSDAAFDRALEIDDHNWGARFTKAVSLSNWPAFLGRGPEAIEHFETLLDQQSEVAPRPEFAMTYLFLGNLYQSSGESAKALETWRAGLALFPDVEDLQRAIGLAQQASGGTER